MYSIIAFLGWSMFGLCSLILLAELIEMMSRRTPGPSAGSFNLRPRESKLSERHDHTFSTRGGGMGGLNKFD